MGETTQRNRSAFRRLRSPGRVLCRPGNPPVFVDRQFYVSMHCKFMNASLLDSKFSGYSFLPVCGYGANPANLEGYYWSLETGYLDFRSPNGNKYLHTSEGANSFSVRCVQGCGRHPLTTLYGVDKQDTLLIHAAKNKLNKVSQ